MVTRLRPLDVTISFADRPYSLGDTIDIDLSLRARRDVIIREGRVDLLCQEYYKQTYTVTVTRPLSPGRGPVPGTPMTTTETKQVNHTRNETYPHSSMVFLTDAEHRSGVTSRHRVRLVIGDEPPQHMSDPTVTEAEVSWSLVAVLDVAQARDVSERRPVQINLG